MKKYLGNLMGGKLLILAPVVIFVVFLLFFLLSYIFEQPLVVKDLKLSNLSDGSVSISYLTDTKVKTAVIASSENSFTVFDAVKSPRHYDERENLATSYTHHVTVRGLTPGSVYYFRILGNLKYVDTTYPVITTLATLDTLNTPAPSYGKFNKVDGVSNDVILFYTLNGSSLQSALLNEDLSVTLDKSNIRKADGSAIVEYKDGDEVKVDVVGVKSQKQSFTFKVGADQPFSAPELKVLNSSVKGVLSNNLVGKVSAACSTGRTYNECCGSGTSRKVTVTACSSDGNNDAGWDAGNCIQPDSACGVPPTDKPSTTCKPGEAFLNGACVSISSNAPRANPDPAPSKAPKGPATNENPLGVVGCPAGMPTVFTCRDNGRFKCEPDSKGGYTTVSEKCSLGCVSSDYGKDDTCRTTVSTNPTLAATGPVDCTPRAVMPDETVIKCAGGALNFGKCKDNKKYYSGSDPQYKNYWIGCTGNSAENTSARTDGIPCTFYNSTDDKGVITQVCMSDATCQKDVGTNYVLNKQTLRCEMSLELPVGSGCKVPLGEGKYLTGITDKDGFCQSTDICNAGGLANPFDFYADLSKPSGLEVYNKDTKTCVEDNTAAANGNCTFLGIGGTYTSQKYCLSDGICKKVKNDDRYVKVGDDCVIPNNLPEGSNCTATVKVNGEDKEVAGSNYGANGCLSNEICALKGTGNTPSIFNPTTKTCVANPSVDKGQSCKHSTGLTGVIQDNLKCLSKEICEMNMKDTNAILVNGECKLPAVPVVGSPCQARVDTKWVSGKTQADGSCGSTAICSAKKLGQVLKADGSCVNDETIVAVNPIKKPCYYEGVDGSKNNVGTNYETDPAKPVQCKGEKLCTSTQTFIVSSGACVEKILPNGTQCEVVYLDKTKGTGKWFNGGCYDDLKCKEEKKEPDYIFRDGVGCSKKTNPGVAFLDNGLVKSVSAQASVLGVSDGTNPTGIKVSETGTYTLGAIDGYTTKVKEVRVIDLSGDNGTLKFFTDTNENGIKDESEAYITDPIQVKLEKVDDNVTYNLVPGWNLMSLNLVMKNVTKASDLLNQIAAQDGYAINISAYRTGQWVTYSQRMGIAIGKDFNLIPGEGYFVKSLKTSKLTLDGKLVEVNSPIFISTGWNLIGLRTDLTNATGLLKEMNKSTNISVDTLTKFQSGRYENLVLDGETVFGADFNLEKEAGYFLRAKKGGASWMKK